jgi:hypothetical protein
MMSVRAPPDSTPIEMFGQDEIGLDLSQSRTWTFPKSLGEGLMISAFVLEIQDSECK